MGIPSYFSHIIQNYPGIQVANPSKNGYSFNHLFMDCNSIIYDVYYSIINSGETGLSYAEMESRLITGIIEKILAYVRIVRPTNIVYIAFDGVAPFAKMEQQRTRRYRSWYLEKMTKGSSVSSYPIYSGMFTPGTPFMQNLSKALTRFFADSKNTADNHIPKFIVSAADEVGEGEHKLFEYLRGYSKEALVKETVALYGLDADLIMLSIFHCNLCNNIFIMREMPVSKNSKNSKAELAYIDTKVLCRGIIQELTGKPVSNMVPSQRNSEDLYIYDYVFLCFFLGNDFLPHFPSLNIRTSGITTLLDTYRTILYSKRLHLISATSTASGQGYGIEWKNLAIFLNELARIEPTLIENEYALRDKSTGRIHSNDQDEYINNLPLMYRAEELYIAPKQYGWQNRYYSSLFFADVDIPSVCRNYLEGLEWVFLYYSSGCPHWRWKYDSAYPPLLQDLKKYITVDMSPIAEYSKTSPMKNRAFTPELQLAYVLPRPYLELLPESVQPFLRDRMDYYPEVAYETETSRIQFVWAFCRFFWESHVILPEIPLDEWGKMAPFTVV